MKGGNRMTSLKSIIRQGKQTRSDLKQLRNAGKVPAVVYLSLIHI